MIMIFFFINQPVQSQKQLEISDINKEELYYSSSENKGADQLCSYCTADLIYAFVFTYAKILFSHDATHLSYFRVHYILNVSREIDNFYPGILHYMNVREWDTEQADLMKHWEDTHRFISKARYDKDA